jgi:2',3'-cyclic-nucleotide 2'-phosphodiesterase (5'-nucleotidase family)/uncharacterized membrane protein
LFFYQFRGKLGVEFMNMMNYTAAAVGVRDFDAAVDGLRDAVQLASFPFLSSNLNLTAEPELSSLISPFTVLNYNGTKVGLVGWISNLLKSEGNPGPTVTLADQLSAVRRSVELLNSQGVNIIIGLSTQDLVETDLNLVSQVSGIDAIVGGYASGGVLYINNNPNATLWPAQGRYPRVASSPSGRAVPIGSIGRFGRFVGRMELEFDDFGFLVNYTGDAIGLTNKVVPNPDSAVQLVLETKYNETQVFRRQVVGNTASALIGDRTICRFRECTLGNLICDAMRNASSANICIFNAGGIRATIPGPGNITYGDVLNSFPFGNTMSTFTIRGSDLALLFNHGVSRAENASNSGTGRFLQLGGVRISWNPALAVGNRITGVQIENPATKLFEALQPQKAYTITTSNFVASGGDNYIDVGLPANVIPGTLALFGRPLDSVLISYLQLIGNVNSTIEGRIVITNSTTVVDLAPPPPPPLERNLLRTGDGLRWGMLAVTLALTIIPLVISFFFFKHRLHAVVVASSEPFVHIILYGAIITYAGLIAFQVGFNNVGCMVFPWLSSVGFAIMYGALFAKTFRIWTVFRGLKTLKRANVTNQQLAIIVSGFVVIELILLIVWTIVSPLQYRTIADATPSIPNDYENCYSENSHIFFAIGLAIKGAYLILGIIMAFVTRKVQSDFSESKYISFSVYGTFVSLVVILVVLFITGLNPTIRFILTTIGGWVVINTIVLTLSVPKLISIISDPDNLWETYFAKRARSMASQSMNRGISSTVSSISSLSESDIRDTVKGMTEKQKEQELTKLMSVWKESMEEQKKLWEDITWLRSDLKRDPQEWTTEVNKFAPKVKKPKKSSTPTGEPKKVAAKKGKDESDSSDSESSSDEAPAKKAPVSKPAKAGAPAAKKQPDYEIESSSEEEEEKEKPKPKSKKTAASPKKSGAKKSAKKTASPKKTATKKSAEPAYEIEPSSDEEGEENEKKAAQAKKDTKKSAPAKKQESSSGSSSSSDSEESSSSSE